MVIDEGMEVPTLKSPGARVFGSSGNDVLKGTSGGDKIYASTGSDLIMTLGGNDIISVSDDSSTDTIDGGMGYDTLNVRLGGDSSNKSIKLGTLNVAGIESFNIDGGDFSSTASVTVEVTDRVFSSTESPQCSH